MYSFIHVPRGVGEVEGSVRSRGVQQKLCICLLDCLEVLICCLKVLIGSLDVLTGSLDVLLGILEVLICYLKVCE